MDDDGPQAVHLAPQAVPKPLAEEFDRLLSDLRHSFPVDGGLLDNFQIGVVAMRHLR